jgi:hypothetical protein
MTWFLIIGAILVLILLIIGVVVSVTSERSLVEKRLGQYIEEEKEKGEKDAAKRMVSPASNSVAHVASSTGSASGGIRRK